MIKYKNEHPTLYGLAIFVSIFISVNNFLLLKLFKVHSHFGLKIINFLTFIMLYFEINLIILVIGKVDIFSYWWQILAGTIFWFLLSYSYLPYWDESQNKQA